MPEILDIVHNLTINSNANEEFSKALVVISNTTRALEVQTNRLKQLEEMYRRTTGEDTDRRVRVIRLISEQTSRIEQQSNSVMRQVTANKQLAQVIQLQINLMNQVAERQRRIGSGSTNTSGGGAFNADNARRYNDELRETERITNRMRGGGGLGNVGQGILSGLGLGAGLGVVSLVSMAVSKIKDLVAESSRLAAEADGVERAFNNINSPDLLENLRKATRGTVSDLELMKQAVNFQNFGLPVERLGQALEFARNRAAETGQSVDYLVNSVVTGIARKSPLILDNLGINTKRVGDEFKKTGDFAQAAFNIIVEETGKADTALTSFAQQQARLNAQLENQQVAFGREINKIYGQLQAEFLDLTEAGIVTYLTTNYNRNKKLYDAAIDEQENYQKRQQFLQEKGNETYLKYFDVYNKQFAQADLAGRDVIRSQAEKLYNDLLVGAKKFGPMYVAVLQNAYGIATKGFAQTPKDLNKITVADINRLSLEELTSLQDQIKNDRNPLNSSDKAQIARYNELEKAIKRNIDAINGVEKPTKRVTDNTKELNEELIKAKNNFKDVKDELEAYGAELDKQAKNIRAAENAFIEAQQDSFTKDLLAPSLPDAQANNLLSQLEKQQRDVLPKTRAQQQQAEIKAAIDTARQRVNIEKAKYKEIQKEGDKYDISEQKKRLKQAKLLLKEAMQPIREEREAAMQSLYGQATQLLQIQQSFYDSEARLLDLQYQRQSDRVTVAVELAKQGNAQILADETARLDAIQRKREENAAKQQRLNAILLASQQALSVAEAIGAVVSAAAKGDPYTIALRIGAAVAALVGGVAAIKGAFAFKDGEVDIKGAGTTTSDSIPARISRGESVINAKATAKYKPILQEINAMRYTPDTVTAAIPLSNKEVVSGIATLTEAVKRKNMKIVQRMDKNGIAMVITEYNKKQTLRRK